VAPEMTRLVKCHVVKLDPLDFSLALCLCQLYNYHYYNEYPKGKFGSNISTIMNIQSDRSVWYRLGN
jgi:hypothetical protein